MESILDSGLYTISQSGVGHILVSTTSAQSIMDFSITPIDDDVVDSPPNGGKHLLPTSSPSPLKLLKVKSSSGICPSDITLAQRKLYVINEPPIAASKVCLNLDSFTFTTFVHNTYCIPPYHCFSFPLQCFFVL